MSRQGEYSHVYDENLSIYNIQKVSISLIVVGLILYTKEKK